MSSFLKPARFATACSPYSPTYFTRNARASPVSFAAWRSSAVESSRTIPPAALRPFRGSQGPANRLRHRVRIEHFVGHRFPLLSQEPALGVAHLMAVHAALHHFSFVIELCLILAVQRRKFVRRLESRGFRLFA